MKLFEIIPTLVREKNLCKMQGGLKTIKRMDLEWELVTIEGRKEQTFLRHSMLISRNNFGWPDCMKMPI